MKTNKFNLLIMVTFISISSIFVGCDKDNNDNSLLQINEVDKAEDFGNREAVDVLFEKSIVVIQRGAVQDPENEERYIFFVELKNFSSMDLNSRYTIGNMLYTDNGEGLDEIAGDGIYTSIQSYKVLNLEENPDVFEYTLVNFSESFEYEEELNDYLSDMTGRPGSSNSGIKIKFGCKVRTVPCPDTDWWNSCWPLPSPCTCVEFYDCEVSVEVEVDTSLF